MQRDTFAGRLVAALARSTPAFQPAVTQSSSRSAARLVAAVSRTTPAFNPPTPRRPAPPSPPPVISDPSKPTTLEDVSDASDWQSPLTGIPRGSRTENATSGREFRYDVFVSYSRRDPVRTWVRSVLVPRLEAAGLRVSVDYLSFHLGAPLVTEMARAIEESRFTLAVLSPDYLANEFIELESVLAEHLGLEETQRRLMVAMREPSRPPLGLRARLYIDMSKDEEQQQRFSRLLQQLQEMRGE
jgi:TIR domain